MAIVNSQAKIHKNCASDSGRIFSLITTNYCLMSVIRGVRFIWSFSVVNPTESGRGPTKSVRVTEVTVLQRCPLKGS